MNGEEDDEDEETSGEESRNAPSPITEPGQRDEAKRSEVSRKAKVEDDEDEGSGSGDMDEVPL